MNRVGFGGREVGEPRPVTTQNPGRPPPHYGYRLCSSEALGRFC
jgi:hypothetical protein